MIYYLANKKLPIFGRSTSIKKQKLLMRMQVCFDMAKNDFQKIALSSVLIRMESYSSSSGGSAINRYNWLSFNF